MKGKFLFLGISGFLAIVVGCSFYLATEIAQIEKVAKEAALSKSYFGDVRWPLKTEAFKMVHKNKKSDEIKNAFEINDPFLLEILKRPKFWEEDQSIKQFLSIACVVKRGKENKLKNYCLDKGKNEKK